MENTERSRIGAAAPAARSSGAALSRFAGAAGLVLVVISFAGLVIPGSLFYSGAGEHQILAWAAGSQRAIWFEGLMDGVGGLLFAVLIVALVTVTGGRGFLATLSYVAVGVIVALGWVQAGIVYGMAELAHRGGSDAGVMALFSLGETVVYGVDFPFAMALACAGLIMLQSRAVPPTLAWFTLILAGLHVVGNTAFVLTGAGAINPVLVLLELVWMLATAIVLLVRPPQVRTEAQAPAREP
jgi:hypothetical protein